MWPWNRGKGFWRSSVMKGCSQSGLEYCFCPGETGRSLLGLFEPPVSCSPTAPWPMPRKARAPLQFRSLPARIRTEGRIDSTCSLAHEGIRGGVPLQQAPSRETNKQRDRRPTGKQQASQPRGTGDLKNVPAPPGDALRGAQSSTSIRTPDAHATARPTGTASRCKEAAPPGCRSPGRSPPGCRWAGCSHRCTPVGPFR
jgi:hypothetical protein